MQGLIEFIAELVSRLGAKTPWFFRVVRALAIITALVTGLPAFLVANGVELPAAIQLVMSTAVSIASIVAAFIAQLTVTAPEKSKLKLKD